MKRLSFICACVVLVGLSAGALPADQVSVMKRPPTDARNAYYAGNREPLLSTPFIKLPVGAVRPEGWIRKQIELQARGFHGHLGDISEFLKKADNAWLSPVGRGSHGWEEPPYWLKGFGNAAYLLQDEALIAETKVWIEGALGSQKPDGWFGPDKDRTGVATDLQGRDDLWPNMIMLFCLQDYHEFTTDRRVIDLMTRYFRYLEGVPENRFLLGYWPKMRGGDLLWSVYWLYNRTGESWLLDLAGKVHRQTADWTQDVINWHNVNMSQGFGQPTTYYMQSKDPRFLQASYRNYDKIRDMYGQVPGGMFGGDENCRPGFTDPRQAVETCGMVEMMLSTERLARITADPVWAARCEDVAFNSLPAALLADMKALRYLTSPNLVLSDRHNKSPGLQNGGPMLLMNPHDHRCCQHNWGHGWPYYAENLIFATPDNGMAAVFYGPCRAEVRVGDGTTISVQEKTMYPFEEKTELVVSTPKAVEFPLYLMVPVWCDAPALELNGKTLEARAEPSSYIRVSRLWSDGDRVVLRLPMKVAIRRWEKNQGSVSVDRGPLTFSLKIGEKLVRAGGTDLWPAWEIHPTTPWNYGLMVDEKDPAASIEVVRREWPVTNMPFTHEGAPIELRAKGRRIPEWQLDDLGLVGKLQPSPVKSEEEVEAITLIPMGAARLRVSSFPVLSDAPGARRWSMPLKPLYKASASHCWGPDTPTAMADGVIPSSSSDGSIRRFTWWDHKGTAEWVQAEFAKTTKVSSVQVYWFDDTGSGSCRVPASWKLLWKQRESWVPVEDSSGFSVERDKFNKTTFRPVSTDALRIEVQLRPDVSGGILEWTVE